jgi:uncharacterized membrane protein YjfL (UPF0719 family)
MELAIYVVVLAIEGLALLWASKKAAGRLLAKDFDNQLTGVDNPAVAVSATGYLIGLFFGLAGLVSSPGRGFQTLLARAHARFWEQPFDADVLGKAVGSDLLWVAVCGILAVPFMVLAARLATFYLHVHVQKDVIDGRNLAAGIVLGASLAATGLIYGASIAGFQSSQASMADALVPSLVFFAAGQVLLWIFAYVYKLVAPFDFRAEIREKKNNAAAAAFAGAILAMGLIVANGVSGDFTRYSTGLRDLALWCAPVILLDPVRKIVVARILLGGSDLDAEITRDRNLGAGFIEAATYLGFAEVAVKALGG